MDTEVAKVKQRRRPLVAALLIAPLVAAIVSTMPRGYVSATEDQYQALIDAFASHGTTIERLPPGQSMVEALPAVTSQVAVDSAVREYGRADVPIVYEAFLTIPDHVPRLERRPVYAVQLTGLRLPPMGGNESGAPIPESRIHHELIIFVDATTGEWIVAQTVR